MAKVSLRAYDREIESMIDRGQLDEAIAHCHYIFKTFPKHLETYRLLGKAYLEYKRYGEAVDIFTRVLVAVPNDFVANVGLSIIRDEENKLDDAIWHMERAFEVQPSNPAINSELSRLYARRDGVAPPHIRMTRGALAYMYMRGELYPAAISEIKSVLKDDAGRSDMQALLAKAHYRSGQKNEAAETASALLRRYPYCLDANIVLAEILGADRPENAKAYRERVLELDPYAAHVNGTLFQSSEASDQAVMIEHLDWNGQPAGATSQADWRDTRAISTGSLAGDFNRDEQPDWLRNAASNNVPTVHPQPKADSDFDRSTPPAQPTPKDEIPDFLRAAGWGESTGTFDESKSTLAEETPAPASDEQPLVQGDLPDWVKAMAPPKEEAQPAEDEDLPDWINNIKPGNVAAASAAAARSDDDWLSQFGQPSQPAAQPAEEQADWLKDLGNETPPASETPDWLKSLGNEPQAAAPAEEQPDWMKNLGNEPPVSSDQPDWLKSLGNEPQAAVPSEDQPDWLKGLGSETPAASDQPDWLKGLGEETTSPAQPSEELDWMKGLGSETPAASQPEEQDDWLKNLGNEPSVAEPAATEPDWMKGLGSETPATPQTEEQDEWLKNLGNEPSATEPVSAEPDWLQGLGDETPSAAPQAEEADWMKQFDAQPEPEEKAEAADLSFLDELTAEPAQETPAPQVPSAVDTSKPGEQDIDDSLAWLEALAAKQGATEGLLVKPEERKQEEPEWVRKIKASTAPVTEQKAPEVTQVPEPPVPATVEPTPSAPVEPPAPKAEDLGKSQDEIDDSLAWLEGLAAKQGATEGLLVKPEERKEQEPEWVRKIKANMAPPVSEQKAPEPPVPPVTEPTPPAPEQVEQPAAKVEDLGKSQNEIDDSLAWLESLAAKQGATEGLLVKPEERKQEEPEWVKKIKASTPPPASEQKVPEPTVPPVPEPAPAPVEEPTASLEEPTPAAVEQPVAKTEDLGKSQTEIDDSLAWLESLAAKQGATEGLLVKPEERRQEEPEWVKKIKASTPPASEQKAPEAPVPPAVEPTSTPVEQPAPNVEDLGKSQREIDDSLAWLESLAAKQGATEGLLTRPEERLEEEPEWVKQAKSAPQTPAQRVEPTPEPASTADDTAAWLRSLDEEESKPEPAVPAADETAMWLKNLDEEKPSVPESEPTADETAMWLKSLDTEKSSAPETGSRMDETAMWLKSLDGEEAAPAPQAAPAEEELPAWMRAIEEEKPAAAEPAIPEMEAELPVEESVAQEESPKVEEESRPSWLSDLEKEESQAQVSLPSAQEDLPAWLRDETGEVVAEPTRIEPTRPTDWKPVEPQRDEIPAPPPPVVDKPEPKPESRPLRPVKKAPAKEVKPTAPPEPYKEPVTRSIRGTGMLNMPTDPILGSARSELTRSNIPGALETYGKLIRKGRFLDEVIFDLREALYRYPVEVSIWQSLGDAYMRANRLQDALDAYTKAEELLR